MDDKIVKPIYSPQQAEQQIEPSTPLPEIVLDESPVEVERETREEEVKGMTKDALNGHYMSDPLFHHVCRELGINANLYHLEAPKIAAIVDWAINETNSTDPSDILWMIKNLERRLPSSGFGEKRHNVIYRYIRLASEKAKIERDMRRYES